jgi:hypothetical protein
MGGKRERNKSVERKRERKCDQWLKTIKEITIKDIQLKEESEGERERENERDRRKVREK